MASLPGYVAPVEEAVPENRRRLAARASVLSNENAVQNDGGVGCLGPLQRQNIHRVVFSHLKLNLLDQIYF